jgi:hypothetical protein
MFSNIPSNRDDNLFIFPGNRSAAGEWKAWTVPPSASYVSILAIGPGGDGGLGFAAAVGAQKGGSGGGGSGGISRAIFRARTLPETIYLDLSTSETTISVEPTTSLYYKLLFALAGGAGGTATSGTSAAGGVGAVNATDASVGPPPLLSSAVTYNTIGGVAGSSGGLALNFFTIGTMIVMGGTGGGSTLSTPSYGGGGSIASSFDSFPGIAGGLPNSGGTGFDGNDGVWYWKPHIVGMGGTGGGAGSAGPGRGGNGAFGCGGGGAGSCVTQNTDAYGRGGPGLIIIKCF